MRVAVGDRSVTATLYRAVEPRGVVCVLAHGAGADQTHPFMVECAGGLAARGVHAVTFNFLYTEERRGAPDRAPLLEACFRAVVAAVPGELEGALAIGGKSMGGRIATHLAAEGLDGLRALVLLGYPLHPPKKPEALRARHLPKIRVPALFVQGTRDPFGGPIELAAHLPPGAALLPVEGADHGFEKPKKLGGTDRAPILDAVAAWLRGICFI